MNLHVTFHLFDDSGSIALYFTQNPLFCVQVTYDEFLQHDPSFRQKTIFDKLVTDSGDKRINLESYMNQSAVSVPLSFSLHRYELRSYYVD